MQRLFFIVLCAALSAMADEPIKVRIQSVDDRIHIGSILGRISGGVQFLPSGGTAVEMPDSQIGYIQFPIEDEEEEQIKRLFEDGEYRQVAELLNAMLPRYRSYVALPSNLTHKFLRWMVASYWTGEYDRVQELVEALGRFKTEEFQQPCQFYRGLVQLEKRNVQAVESALNSPNGDALYPPGSAVRLYIDARLQQERKDYVQAIRTAALLMAEHSRDANWMPRAELLCAELYFQLDMPESARSVLDSINEVYRDPLIKKKAAEIAAWR